MQEVIQIFSCYISVVDHSQLFILVLMLLNHELTYSFSQLIRVCRNKLKEWITACSFSFLFFLFFFFFLINLSAQSKVFKEIILASVLCVNFKETNHLVVALVNKIMELWCVRVGNHAEHSVLAQDLVLVLDNKLQIFFPIILSGGLVSIFSFFLFFTLLSFTSS